MIQKIILVSCCLAATWLVQLGCATPGVTSRPFSEGWRENIESEQEFKHRQRRISGQRDKDGDERGGIVRDEEGKPRLNVGGLGEGVSADVDLGGSTSGQLKYRWDWDFARPQRR